MLPDVEGIEVGRRVRERGFGTAILFLTAKDAVENKVEALRAGGDDYVTKPFSLAEVVARVQAILRRTGSELPGDVLRFADVALDESRHEVRRGETLVELTATEFALLRFFLLNPRRVLSKGQILQNVWHYDFARQLERRRDVRELSPEEARRARPAAHPHGAAGRVHARSGGVMRRLSLRARLLLGVCPPRRRWARRPRTSRRTRRCARSSSQQVDAALESGPSGLRWRRGAGQPADPRESSWVGFGAQSGGAVSGQCLVRDCSAAATAGDGTLHLPADTDGPDEPSAYFTVASRDQTRRTASAPRSSLIAPGMSSSWPSRSPDVDTTLHRLLLIELLVTLAVLAALAALGFWIMRLGLRPLREIEADGGRDHGRRPVASRRASRSADGSRTARRGAQHDARPDRGVGQASASLRRRRLARAPHATRRGARVRRALRSRRRERDRTISSGR